MNIEQATAEASRRSKVKVTMDGATERIYVRENGVGNYSVHRWIDVPIGSVLVACYLNGFKRLDYQAEVKR